MYKNKINTYLKNKKKKNEKITFIYFYASLYLYLNSKILLAILSLIKEDLK